MSSAPFVRRRSRPSDRPHRVTPMGPHPNRPSGPLIVAVLSSLLAAPLSAQTSPPDDPDSIDTPGPALLITGTIVDVGTDSAVAGAAITLEGTGYTKWTNERRRFAFTRDELSFPDTLVVRRLGYDSARVVLSEEPGEPVRVRLSLQRRALAVEGLTVEGERRARSEAERMVDLFGGRIWSREDFGDRVAMAQNPLDMLRWSNMVSLIEEDRRGGRCVMLPGGRGCALIMVNNVRMSSETIATVAPETVESFVVLGPLEATIPYGTGAANAVVVIFTGAGRP